MELTKVMDGFIVNDTLVVKAQVQVISSIKTNLSLMFLLLKGEKGLSFRCLDCQYRRELACVYRANVEQICGSFVEEKQKKLGDLLGDSARWSSFCAFWLGVDRNVRRRMYREKTDVILKVVVKQFFVEKEVTSTLVMESLYSVNTAGEKVMDAAESRAPIVCVENGIFILVDDVLLLIERAALEVLPLKDEKGPQNPTKVAGVLLIKLMEAMVTLSVKSRLAELGRRTLEIIALTHIFRQEELIGEEEEIWQAESQQKVNGGAADKEKRAKKKQGNENLDVSLQDKMQSESTLHNAIDGFSLNQASSILDLKPDTSGAVQMYAEQWMLPKPYKLIILFFLYEQSITFHSIQKGTY
ncbi:hypothetical protein MKX03_035718 [Papaver bracteatum]|nr:hypothetical protein MKX03_035718 [Papaver bracteatum]